MRLIKQIPLDLVDFSFNPLDYPQFVLVISQGYLKIYKQVC